MSATHENDNDEAAADRETARCRQNRRPSVQFIDKNLSRRRSSGNEKPASAQPQRLSSINSNYEVDPNDIDHLQQYSTQLSFRKSNNRFFLLRFFFSKTQSLSQNRTNCLSFFLATASDSDSDADDQTTINIRELEHVSFNYRMDSFVYVKCCCCSFYFIEKCAWFYGLCRTTY